MTTTITPTNINETSNIKTPGITINQIFSDHGKITLKNTEQNLEICKILALSNFLVIHANNGTCAKPKIKMLQFISQIL